ncbi:hypothetical protein NDI52_32420 [Leptolyngbya sp. PL-A3]|uniref:hypothetical protein n=1 Tax=Leptolyngbya sp. PL-A3 TaxID=2933911 RepID=UPI0032996446
MVVALDVADALQRSQRRPEHFGLILMNQVRQSIDEVLAIGEQLRQNAGLDPYTPILIMAENYGPDLEGQDISVGNNVYVSYLEDGEQLKAMLQQLCPVS